MDRNNDFDRKKYPSDLDEYVAREIMQYYGEDVINSINSSDIPPKKKKKISRYRSVVSIICSVIFLVGAIIFSGVVIASGVPKAEQDSPDSTDNTSSYISGPINTDTSDLKNVNTESDTSSVTSAETGSKTDDTIDDSSKTESDISSAISSEVNSKPADTNNDSSKEESDISSVTSSEVNSKPDDISNNSSEAESDTSSLTSSEVSSKPDDTSNNSSEAEAKSDASSVTSPEASSKPDDTNNDSSQSQSGTPSEISRKTTDTEERPGYYSLPEIPDEGTVTEIESDINNNESTNPYDNVTTGKRVKAGIGIFLMLMSLTISFVLKKTEIENED